MISIWFVFQLPNFRSSKLHKNNLCETNVSIHTVEWHKPSDLNLCPISLIRWNRKSTHLTARQIILKFCKRLADIRFWSVKKWCVPARRRAGRVNVIYLVPRHISGALPIFAKVVILMWVQSILTVLLHKTEPSMSEWLMAGPATEHTHETNRYFYDKNGRTDPSKMDGKYPQWTFYLCIHICSISLAAKMLITNRSIMTDWMMWFQLFPFALQTFRRF